MEFFSYHKLSNAVSCKCRKATKVFSSFVTERYTRVAKYSPIAAFHVVSFSFLFLYLLKTTLALQKLSSNKGKNQIDIHDIL